MKCKICGNASVALGFCKIHYYRFRYQRDKIKILKQQKERYQLKKEEIALKSKEYYRKNSYKIKQRVRQYNKDNKDKIKIKKKKYNIDNQHIIKKYRDTHKKERAEYNRIYRKNNSEKIKNLMYVWRKENKYLIKERNKLPEIKLKNLEYSRRPEIKEKNKIYQINNRPKINKYIKQKCVSDKRFKNAFLLRGRLSKILNKKTKSRCSFLNLVSCEPDYFYSYIESKFKNGMSWDNYGEVWCIDHIIPIKWFELTDWLEQKKCFHYTNLQPLTFKENIQKGCKIADSV